ncbi:MAG: hypothetical protein FJZ04_03765, partial [Candidatus Moranbacteria bacterium]|nr:hypothetical protein [Candidatus Moranbacteria bacterium]
MIIVNLKGGMGNQMFQYALGRALAIKNKNEFKMDLTYLKEGQPKSPDHTFRVYDLGIFNVKENFATKRDLEYFYSRSTAKQILNHLLPKYFPRNNIIYDKDSYVFNPEILEQKGNLYLDGYWQTDKYFESIGPLIRREFTFRKNFDAKNQQLASEISNNNSVCLNVRRADYVKIAHMTKHHG